VGGREGGEADKEGSKGVRLERGRYKAEGAGGDGWGRQGGGGANSLYGRKGSVGKRRKYQGNKQKDDSEENTRQPIKIRKSLIPSIPTGDRSVENNKAGGSEKKKNCVS